MLSVRPSVDEKVSPPLFGVSHSGKFVEVPEVPTLQRWIMLMDSQFSKNSYALCVPFGFPRL